MSVVEAVEEEPDVLVWLAVLLLSLLVIPVFAAIEEETDVLVWLAVLPLSLLAAFEAEAVG